MPGAARAWRRCHQPAAEGWQSGPLLRQRSPGLRRQRASWHSRPGGSIGGVLAELGNCLRARCSPDHVGVRPPRQGRKCRAAKQAARYCGKLICRALAAPIKRIRSRPAARARAHRTQKLRLDVNCSHAWRQPCRAARASSTCLSAACSSSSSVFELLQRAIEVAQPLLGLRRIAARAGRSSPPYRSARAGGLDVRSVNALLAYRAVLTKKWNREGSQLGELARALLGFPLPLERASRAPVPLSRSCRRPPTRA